LRQESIKIALPRSFDAFTGFQASVSSCRAGSGSPQPSVEAKYSPSNIHNKSGELGKPRTEFCVKRADMKKI
jgi:hypothetical protein